MTLDAVYVAGDEAENKRTENRNGRPCGALLRFGVPAGTDAGTTLPNKSDMDMCVQVVFCYPNLRQKSGQGVSPPCKLPASTGSGTTRTGRDL